jgi:predicted aminopeptidase
MPPRQFPSLDRRCRRWVPFLLAACLNGCASYYGQLAQGQLALLRAREPVAAVVADPARPAELRRRLALSQQARDFASARLALPDNGSYRQYADIHRPFVVWNVFATEEFSVDPVTHCFPIAGCVAYRGYYRQGRARGAAALLRQQGYDTYVGGVEAYSTLGWFDDPLLSSMLRWDDDQLAATIFHELTHQKLYVRDDSVFDESLAHFVEQQGLREWRASRGLPRPDATLSQRRDRFIRLVLQTRQRLAQLYAGDLPPAAMRQAKQAEFEHLRREYEALRDGPWHGDRRFDAWVYGPLNNAKLLPFGLYDQYVPAFARLFDQCHGDWPAFFAAARRIGELQPATRHAELDRLLAADASSPERPDGPLPAP